MTTDQLPDHLEPGLPLTLHCRTTSKALDNTALPTGYHTARIPYVLHGTFEHYRLLDGPPALVIRSAESGKLQHVYLTGIESIVCLGAPVVKWEPGLGLTWVGR